MTTLTNAEILQQYKSRLLLIVEQIQLFTLSTNFVREVKKLSLTFQRILKRSFTLQKILIRIDRSIFFFNPLFTQKEKN